MLAVFRHSRLRTMTLSFRVRRLFLLKEFYCNILTTFRVTVHVIGCWPALHTRFACLQLPQSENDTLAEIQHVIQRAQAQGVRVRLPREKATATFRDLRVLTDASTQWQCDIRQVSSRVRQTLSATVCCCTPHWLGWLGSRALSCLHPVFIDLFWLTETRVQV